MRLEEVLLAYAAVWSEVDPARRQSLLAQCLSSDGEIIGPGYHLKGYAAISADVERFRRERPGFRAVFASGFVEHSGWARFAVAVIDPAGALVYEGEDIVELGDDGRIVRVITFWGALPPAPSNWPAELVVPRAR